MFDNLHYHQHDSGSKTVNITERRAPTDESVRLLAEMERAAEKKIAQAIRLENCPVDCVIHRQDDYRNQKMLFAVHAKIGGQQIEARKDFHLDGTDFTEIAQGLMQALAEQIAIRMLAPAFNSVASKLRLPR